MNPQQIYSWHGPLAIALLVLVALLSAVETVRRRR
jgi:hypothetical protein